MVSQVRRRGTACRARRGSSGHLSRRPRAGALGDDVLEASALRSSSSTRTPAATSRALISAASAVRTKSRSPPAAQPARRGGGARHLRRGCEPHAAGRRLQRGEILLDDQTAAVEQPDAGAELLDFGEQVAGEEDRGARGVEGLQKAPNLEDALGVKPVGGLVKDEQLGLPQEGTCQSQR